MGKKKKPAPDTSPITIDIDPQAFRDLCLSQARGVASDIAQARNHPLYNGLASTGEWDLLQRLATQGVEKLETADLADPINLEIKR